MLLSAGHQAQEIYSPADRRLSGINAVHCQIINQMHAGLITCRQGETFGTLIIKLKLNLNCKFFFSYFQCQLAFAVLGALCGLKKSASLCTYLPFFFPTPDMQDRDFFIKNYKLQTCTKT